jgi:formylglycine-generating enzyme required for sulfatase activity
MTAESILGFQKFASRLQQEWKELDAENLADIFWLASHLSSSQTEESPVANDELSNVTTRTTDEVIAPPAPSGEREEKAPIVIPPKPSSDESSSSRGLGAGIPLQVAAANALRSRLDLARALRPLMRKVPSPTQFVLDVESTAIRYAEQLFWSPVLVPAPERWLDLAIVVEVSSSLEIWHDTIAELVELVEQQGIFRHTSTWRLHQSSVKQLQVSPNWNSKTRQSDRSLDALKDPTRRQIIWLVSDCTSDLWLAPPIYRAIADWGKFSPIALVQLFPERLWSRTSLGLGRAVRLPSVGAAASLNCLKTAAKPVYPSHRKASPLKDPAIVPIVSIEPEAFKRWAKVTAGFNTIGIIGIETDLANLPPHPPESETMTASLTAEDRVLQFCATASVTAQRLAGLIAAVPVSLPIVHLIQKTMLPQSQQVHVAEVFMGGLMELITNIDPPQYQFIKDVRETIVDAVPTIKTMSVIDTVSAYISQRLGLGIKNFAALIADPALTTAQKEELQPFAEIALSTLKRLGGDYRVMAERLEQHLIVPEEKPIAEFSNWPPITQPHTFLIAEIELEELQRFDFKTAKIAREKKNSKKWEITKSAGYSWQRTEELEDGILLKMVEIIGGTFLMGASEGEPESAKSEKPQHEVILGDFFMSKYLITQSQWKAVATDLPKSKIDLNPEPSQFKGDDNRPVEQVSWFEAVEFCDRLSVKTGREYRLPTEAEWEYACRADTTTPFHFGETLSSELAIYDWDSSYNNGPKGGDRREVRRGTEPVGNFPANAFGLYDMHGNVFEWCLDTWHDNYSEKPEELKKSGNTPWVSSDKSDEKRLLRGGSWVTFPRYCRSAYRDFNRPVARDSGFGFRVVSCVARTLP